MVYSMLYIIGYHVYLIFNVNEISNYVEERHVLY